MNKRKILLPIIALLASGSLIFAKETKAVWTCPFPSMPTFCYDAPPTPTPIPMPTFCPGFPFCTTPTVSPSSTPTPTVIPTPSASISPTPLPTATPSSVPTAKIKHGAYVGDGFNNLTNVTNFENLVGKKLKVVLFYTAWGTTDPAYRDFNVTWMNNIKNNGSIPMITWEPWNYQFGVNQANYSLQTIINGNHDTYIRKFAQDSRSWGSEYYLRPMHEMNGNWYPWAASVNGNTSEKYIQAWKRIVDIFRAEGANNVKYVWCPNVTYSGSTPLSLVFPGDDYVDYICLDGYNWGDTNGGWQTFTQIFKPSYDQITALSTKPVVIGETASNEWVGNKATWITNAYGAEIDSMPRITIINWFNANKEKDWRVNSSTNSLNAYKQVIQNSKYE